MICFSSLVVSIQFFTLADVPKGKRNQRGMRPFDHTTRCGHSPGAYILGGREAFKIPTLQFLVGAGRNGQLF